MRILLVEAYEIGDNPFVSDWLMQPLGLMYLAASAENAGYRDIRIFDTKIQTEPVENFLKVIKDYSPDVLGVRSFSSSASFSHLLIDKAKELKEDLFVVTGGPYTNSDPEELLANKNVNCIVLGEGEATFPKLLKAVEDRSDLLNIPGIAYRKDDKTIYTDAPAVNKDLDSLPYPAWHLIDHSPYSKRYELPKDNICQNLVQVRKNCMPLFTSRGCPYQCIYCHKIFGKGFRPHSPERVLSEIDKLYDNFDVRQFDFYDDVFNLDRKRAAAILQGVSDRRKSGRDIKLSFFNGLRADIQDGDLVRLFKEAGTFMIPYAVETASPRLQKIIKKNLDLDKLKKIVRLTSMMGIVTVGFAMLGHPGETKEEAEATIDFMLNSDFDMAEIFITSPFKGTELANSLIENNGENSKDMFRDIHYLKPAFKVSNMEYEELKDLQLTAYDNQLSDKSRREKLLRKINYHRNH